MTEPDETRTLHTPPTNEADSNVPAYNALRIRKLLADGYGTIDLYRTTADGGSLNVGRARYCRDTRYDVMVMHPEHSRIVGYAKFVDGLTWSVWQSDGHWVGYCSTLAYGADILNHGHQGATSNRMYRGALTFEHGET